MSRPLLLLVFMLALSRIALRMAIVPFFPELMVRYGAGYTQMGLLFSAFLMASLACQVPAGILADRVPPRPILAVCLVIMAAASLFLLGAPTWTSALGARAMMGAASAALYPAQVRLLYRLAPRSRLGSAFGVDEGGVGFAIFVSLALLPLVAEQLGFAVANGVLVVLAVGAAAWVWRAVPAGLSPRPPGSGRTGPGREPAPPEEAGPSPYGHYSLLRRVGFLVLFAAAGSYVVTTVITWLPTYLRDSLSLGTGSASLVLGVLTAANFLMALGAGRLSDWYGRRLPIANAGAALVAVGLIALLVWPDAGGLTGLALLGLLLGSGMSLAVVPMLVLIPSLFGPARAGLTSALLVVAAQVGAVTASTLTGYLVDRTGSFTLSWVICLSVLAVRTGASFLIRE